LGIRGLETRPGFGEYAPEDALNLVELSRADRQRRGELHDRIAAVVGAARIRNLDGVIATETFVYLKLHKQFYNWGTR
jgi:hypothetical protein